MEFAGQANPSVFDDGGLEQCEIRTQTKLRCAQIAWPGRWFANERPKFRPLWWHGSVVEDKRDATGTLYRRNRYLDAQTGRFTQEDQIGLAGGLNAYGFANDVSAAGVSNFTAVQQSRDVVECRRSYPTRAAGSYRRPCDEDDRNFPSLPATIDDQRSSEKIQLC